MPDKMRGIPSDIAGISHWIGRKFRNHNPMSDRDKAVLETTNGRVTKRGKFQVGVVASDDSCVYYELRNGRRFIVQTREMEPEEETPILQAVRT